MLSNFLFKLNSFAPVSGLSNEIPCILVAQVTAKLLKVKVGGLKKILPLGPASSAGYFFLTLTSAHCS